MSNQKTVAVNDSLTWTNDPSRRSGGLDASNTGALGMIHTILIGKKTLLKTVFSLNGTKYNEEDYRYDKVNGPLIYNRNNQFKEQNAILSITANHKLNTHHLIRMGAYTTFKEYALNQRESVSNILRDKVKSEGSTLLTQYFTQWKWDPSNKFRFELGFHGQYFSLNNTSSLEPRLGMRFRTGRNDFLSLGIWITWQIQPLGNYFARIKVGADSIQPNKTLDFSKSNHFVIGYSKQLAPNWNLKTELYYQSLFNIPITAVRPTSFSVINMDDDYAIETLSNKGKGENYGLEITLERYWTDQFYLLATASIYESKYLPSDKNLAQYKV